jgi:prevent-host-death family protein
MKDHPIFDAKNNLSALIADAREGIPQFITKNGVRTAVIISYKDYLKLTAKTESLVDFLMNSPLRGSGIDLSRSQEDAGRETLEF